MNRRNFLTSLALVPVALKALISKAPGPVIEAVKPVQMSNGTGGCSFNPQDYHGELTWIRHRDSSTSPNYPHVEINVNGQTHRLVCIP